MTLSELFESNDWICTGGFVKQGQLWIMLFSTDTATT